MKVFLSAGEASSDIHGAVLLKALQQEAALKGDTIEAFGMGGPELQKAGLRSIVDTRELLAMGFTEILSRIFKFSKALKVLSQAIRDEKPAVIIVLDYPDFHFRLIRKVSSLNIPSLYFIPPKVWIWRSGRVKFLKNYFREILCIFPFEELFFSRAQVKHTYVGNPLIEELPLTLTREQARNMLKIGPSEKVVLLMPGSRPAELKRHIPVMVDALKVYSLTQEGVVSVCVPLPMTAKLEEVRAQFTELESSSLKINLVLTQGNSAVMMKAADFGIIKSGTSTLEAALLGCPHVLIYKPSLLSTWIVRYFIRYFGPVGLVNLILGKKNHTEYAVPEILAEEVTSERLCQELKKFDHSVEYKAHFNKSFQEVREKLGIGQDGKIAQAPSQKAALRILSWIKMGEQ